MHCRTSLHPGGEQSCGAGCVATHGECDADGVAHGSGPAAARQSEPVLSCADGRTVAVADDPARDRSDHPGVAHSLYRLRTSAKHPTRAGSRVSAEPGPTAAGGRSLSGSAAGGFAVFVPSPGALLNSVLPQRGSGAGGCAVGPGRVASQAGGKARVQGVTRFGNEVVSL